MKTINKRFKIFNLMKIKMLLGHNKNKYAGQSCPIEI